MIALVLLSLRHRVILSSHILYVIVTIHLFVVVCNDAKSLICPSSDITFWD